MYQLRFASRQVRPDVWQQELNSLASDRFEGLVEPTQPEKQSLSLLGAKDVEPHKVLDSKQVLALQARFELLRSEKLPETYSLHPQKVLIKNPRSIFLAFENSPEVEEDRFALRSLLTAISGREVPARPLHNNVLIGVTLPEAPATSNGDIIHAITDYIMPEIVIFERPTIVLTDTHGRGAITL